MVDMGGNPAADDYPRAGGRVARSTEEARNRVQRANARCDRERPRRDRVGTGAVEAWVEGGEGLPGNRAVEARVRSTGAAGSTQQGRQRQDQRERAPADGPDSLTCKSATKGFRTRKLEMHRLTEVAALRARTAKPVTRQPRPGGEDLLVSSGERSGGDRRLLDGRPLRGEHGGGAHLELAVWTTPVVRRPRLDERRPGLRAQAPVAKRVRGHLRAGPGRMRHCSWAMNV